MEINKKDLTICATIQQIVSILHNRINYAQKLSSIDAKNMGMVYQLLL